MSGLAQIGKPRALTTEAPWRWLSRGWADLWKNPLISLGYGAVFVFGGLGISFFLWQIGLSATIPVAAGAFCLIGPMMAVGLYELSRRYETGEQFTLSDIVLVKTKSPVQLAYIGFFLMFAMLVWGRIAMMIYAIFISSTYMPISDFSKFILETQAGIGMLIVGTIVGGIIAFAIFAVTALSVPMLMDKKTDLMTAVIKSIQSVNENSAAMFQWAWLIVMCVSFGIATLFLGLIFIFPLLGHATWHAYQDVYGSQE